MDFIVLTDQAVVAELLTIQPFADEICNYTSHDGEKKRYEYVHLTLPPFRFARPEVATRILYHIMGNCGIKMLILENIYVLNAIYCILTGEPNSITQICVVFF